jgi:hypothetical protein
VRDPVRLENQQRPVRRRAERDQRRGGAPRAFGDRRVRRAPPRAAFAGFDQEGPIRRLPRGGVEQLDRRTRVRAQRLADEAQRTVGRALRADQVTAPSSTVPRMR